MNVERSTLLKVVETKYIDYCIHEILETSMKPVFLKTNKPDRHRECYDYEEESTEPSAGRIDYHMVEHRKDDKEYKPELRINVK